MIFASSVFTSLALSDYFRYLSGVCIVIGLSFGFSSCYQFRDNDQNHPEVVSKIIAEANTIRYAQGDDSTIKYLNTAFDRIPNPGIRDRYQKYETILGYLFWGKPNLARARLYADSMQYLIVKADAEIKYKKEFGRAYFFKGDLARAEKKYDDAFNYYFQGKLFVEDPKDSCSYYQYFSKVANVYFELGEFKQAGELYKRTYQSLTYCQNKSDFNEQFVEMQGNLCNIGTCYLHRNMPDSALFYYRSALDFISIHSNEYPSKKDFMEIAQAVVQGQMAEVYAFKKDYGMALTLLKNSIAVNIKKGRDNKYAQYTQNKLIDLYLETGELENAKTELASLRVSLDTLANESMEIEWYDHLSQYFLRNHDSPNAFKSFRNYVALRDSLSEKKSRLASMSEVLNRKQYDHNMDLVRKRVELDRLYLIGTITTAIMAIIIAFLVWQNWRRARKNLNKLERLNHQISEHNIHMQNALSDLERSQEQNTTMMKVVAHDLRSPIGSVQMAAASLLEEENYSQTQKALLKVMHATLGDSMRLIGNLLKSSTQTKNRKEAVALHTMINYCVSMMQFKADNKNQQLELNLEKVVVMIDREKIWRVISNLITNAIKFSLVGGKITIELKKLNNTALILVKDRGIGVPDEYKNQIFELYTDRGREGTSGEQSYGMGLAISRLIIQDHNGRLWFESEIGKGTTFYIELPLEVYVEDDSTALKI